LNSSIEVFLTSHRDFVQRCVGCRVERMSSLGRWYNVVVDDVARVGLVSSVRVNL
jgi:hypothetical protein